MELDEAWRRCPLISGYPQEAPGMLGLEGEDTPDRGPDSLVGKWKSCGLPVSLLLSCTLHTIFDTRAREILIKPNREFSISLKIITVASRPYPSPFLTVFSSTALSRTYYCIHFTSLFCFSVHPSLGYKLYEDKNLHLFHLLFCSQGSEQCPAPSRQTLAKSL